VDPKATLYILTMKKIPVRSELLMAVTMTSTISWDMMSGESTVSIFKIEACLHDSFFASEDGDIAVFQNVRK
jgi:hypothetical protein